MKQPRKPPHLSPADLRVVRELLRAELRPLTEEIRKLRKELKPKDNG